jgi:hypothetical protein
MNRDFVMKMHSRKWSAWTALALAFGLAACSSGPQATTAPAASSEASALNLPPPGPYQVTVDSKWAYSANENRPAGAWLLQRARDIASEGSTGLDRLVARWPDVTLDVLRDGVTSDADLPVVWSLADSYDRVFHTADPAAGWSNALTVSASQHDVYISYITGREHVLELFKTGQYSQAATVDLVGALPASAPLALLAEALRLEGLSALLNDRPQQAADFFTRAVDAARLGPRHVQFEVGLLLSESERRINRPGAAALTWQNTVAAAGDIRDPDLWERAILAKPDGFNWPAQTSVAASGEPDFSNGLPPDTSDVLIRIGKMRLARGATQAALLAFSRAENETAIPGKKALARLYRAQTMIQLQLVASALPLLDGLLNSPDPRISCRANAVEGDVDCRILGDRKHGIPLMSRGLTNPDSGEWPGKNQLSANLGLYLLLEGDDSKGLSLLHLAESQFEETSQWEDLARALQDEAAYLRVVGKVEEAAVVQRRADDISRKAGLPTGPLVDQSSAAASAPENSSTE